ncbi:MAG: hypothetical protein JKY96_03425, partial [Phycisphaerales bacterium]|nr:hypothetical protein [Phycisphaerales bacterium]
KQAIGTGAAVGVWIPWAGIRVSPDAGQAQIHLIEYELALMDIQAADQPSDAPPNAQMGRLIRISSGPSPVVPGAICLNATEPSDWLAPAERIPAMLGGEVQG